MSLGPTTLRLGWTNPLTGVFGAHPTLGAILDLNDAATFTLVSPDGLDLSPPEPSVMPARRERPHGRRAGDEATSGATS